MAATARRFFSGELFSSPVVCATEQPTTVPLWNIGPIEVLVSIGNSRSIWTEL
ncbi:hypothetical protein M6B38_376295 [Iris pallida]|uniref:Uncharacterized protein n=1 Tax=Iris pallida TaxID=29817 RepID=A0AAX6GB43_IRIPA|nr:hypothetical protein M6B38_376295 [Iris pallida]